MLQSFFEILYAVWHNRLELTCGARFAAPLRRPPRSAGDVRLNDVLGVESRALPLSPFCVLLLGSGLVQVRSSANESLQRLFVYLLALVEVDGAPRVAIKT